MSKNKNNQPIWNTRIKKGNKILFNKVGGSLNIDKRLFNEDIEASIVHVEMLFKQVCFFLFNSSVPNWLIVFIFTHDIYLL